MREIKKPIEKDGRTNAETVKVRPSFAHIFSAFIAGMSQAGEKNPSAKHTGRSGHGRSRKFKGYMRENRRCTFNKNK